MLLLIVWIAVVVLALVVLGAIGYGVLGAAGRLGRELEAIERDVRPLIQQARATAATASSKNFTDARGAVSPGSDTPPA